jgi:hypothetical protein
MITNSRSLGEPQRIRAQLEIYSEKYLYDGWNLTAILRSGQGGGGAAFTLNQSFIWGPDLSSTLQGAGGVGGWLMIVNSKTGKAHFPAYDGNGNVMAQ